MASMDGFPQSGSLSFGSSIQPLASTASTASLLTSVKSENHPTHNTNGLDGHLPLQQPPQPQTPAPTAAPKKLTWTGSGVAVQVASGGSNTTAPKVTPSLTPTVGTQPRMGGLPLTSPPANAPRPIQLANPSLSLAKPAVGAGIPLTAGTSQLGTINISIGSTPSPSSRLITTRVGDSGKISPNTLKPVTFSSLPVKGATSTAATTAEGEDTDANGESKKRKREEVETPQEALMRKKLRAAVMSDFGKTLLPEFMAPFADLDDAVDRLLPFHLYQDYDAYEGSYAVAVSAEKAEFPELELQQQQQQQTQAQTSTESTPQASTGAPVATAGGPAAIVPGMTSTSTQALNSITTTTKFPETPAGKAALERGWRSEYLKSPNQGKPRRHRDADFPDDDTLLDIESDGEGTFEEKINRSANLLLERANQLMSSLPARYLSLYDTTPMGLVPKEETFLMQRLLYSEEHSELTEEKSTFDRSRREETAQKQRYVPIGRGPPPGIAAVQIKLAELVRIEMTKRRNNPNQMKVLNSLLTLANKADLPQEQLKIVKQVVENTTILETLLSQSASGAKAAGAATPARPPGR